MAFGTVVEKLAEHYGIEVPESAVREISLGHGAEMLEQQEQERQTELGPQAGVEQLLSEIDGSMIPMVEAAAEAADKRKNKRLYWEEARLCLARELGSVEPRFGATLGEAQEAGEVWVDCVKRAGAGEATRIHCLGDGAKWIIEQARTRFGAQGSYLLDFYHVSEYLAAAGAVIAPQQSKDWLHTQQQLLRENRVAAVLAQLLPHIEASGLPDEAAPVRVCYRYLTNHRSHLDYRAALAAGLPIGSGEVESGHRYIIQERLKLAGAWWKRVNAGRMLALRLNRANHEWKSYWQLRRQAVA